MAIAAILLAAGADEIDGMPLALLPWRDDETLIEYHVAQLQAAGVDAIEVVLGYDAERVIPIIAREDVEPIVNARWRTDAASSVRVGASAVPRDTQAAIVVRLNEPRPADVYRRLLDAHLRTGAPITRPAFRGVPGAPIVVGHTMLAELRNATDNSGLDGIIAGHADEIAGVAFDNRIVLVHIAGAESYRQARSDCGFG